MASPSSALFAEEESSTTDVVPFAPHVDIRPLGDQRLLSGGSLPELRAWIRLTEPHPYSPALAAVLLDALFPSLYAVQSEPVPVPTAEITAHVAPTGSARALPRRRRAVDRRGRLLGPGPPVAPDPAPASQQQPDRPPRPASSALALVLAAGSHQPPHHAMIPMAFHASATACRGWSPGPLAIEPATGGQAAFGAPGVRIVYLYATCSMHAVATSGAPSHLRRRCWLTPSRRVRGP